MKILKYAAVTAACIAAVIGIAKAARVVYSQTLVSETALAYNNTYSLDLGASLLPHSNIDSLSMQAVYSSATVAAVSFVDGVKSTGTLTVNTYTALQGAQATNTLTVANTSYLAANPASFTLNGYLFQKGDLWNVGASSAVTAGNICSAINTYGATSPTFSCSTTSAGVATITVISSGTAGNLYTLVTSSNAALTRGGATFSGGKNHGFIVIAGVSLVEGTDFSAATSSHTTASNIKAAIDGNSTLSALVTTSTSGTTGVVTLTSKNVGANTNYGIFTSSDAALTALHNGLTGGTDSNVISNVFTKANHGLTTGLAVLYTKSAGTDPQNLAANTTYYAIRVNSNQFKLATSQGNATAGTAITISTVTGSGSFTLTPLAIAGTPSFKWQGSNDNANWYDLNVSSVTMTSLAPATTLWDFGSVNYRYVRLNVVAPTQGGINLVVTGVGRSNY